MRKKIIVGVVLISVALALAGLVSCWIVFRHAFVAPDRKEEIRNPAQAAKVRALRKDVAQAKRKLAQEKGRAAYWKRQAEKDTVESGVEHPAAESAGVQTEAVSRAEVLAFLKNPNGEWRRMLDRLGLRLTSADFRVALERFPKEEGERKKIQRILERWAVLDPEAAAQWATAELPQIPKWVETFAGVARSWLKGNEELPLVAHWLSALAGPTFRDEVASQVIEMGGYSPDLAYSLIRETGVESHCLRRKVVIEKAQALATVDVKQAWEWAQTSSDPTENALALQGAAFSGASSDLPDPVAVVECINAYKDEGWRLLAKGEIVYGLSGKNAHLAKMAESLLLGSAQDEMTAVHSIVQSMRADEPNAPAWSGTVNDIQDKGLRDMTILGMASQLGKKNPQAVVKWINEILATTGGTEEGQP